MKGDRDPCSILALNHGFETVHRATVRQRLATIEDLLGHWSHASRMLEIHVALRLWSLSRPAHPTG